MSTPFFVCSACRQQLRDRLRSRLSRHVAVKRGYTRPSFAPKPVLDLKHIRLNPGLYEQNCVDRNYTPQAKNGWKILELHERLVAQQREVVALRQRNNVIGKELKQAGGQGSLLEEARTLKAKLADFEKDEKHTQQQMESLALELPNLSSLRTPVGNEPDVIDYINPIDASQRVTGKNHVDVGKEFDLLDFEASATSSGWGWYFLKNEAALLEQALIQYSLSVAMKRGWQVMTPPSLVYSHIANACGFMPRDQNGETQIYNIGEGSGSDKAGLVLAGTAEIPFAASQANKTLYQSDLPLKVIGPSRCYRAEAGARGVDTKGLYRVHEFTKVEMFAWTKSSDQSSDDSSQAFAEAEAENEADTVFNEMISIQEEILTSLGLHARILEMPTGDLGASASRKIDIEVFFPSRTAIDNGYGEVTSASQCGTYQSRRLGTKVKGGRGGNTKLDWPQTVNGTAMAIPRVLAALLENGYDKNSETIRIPECLRKWMPGEMEMIRRNPSRSP